MIFAGEQVREIGFERTIGTAETFVRVVPSLRFWMNSLLCEKRLPAFMPGFESFREALPVKFCELESEDAEFLSRFGDRFARDVLLDRLDLMELAELDGKLWEAAFEHGNDPFASVDDEAGELMSCSKQCVEGFFVVHDLLGDDFLPVEVPAVGAAHKDPVAASEERGIHGDDNGVRGCLHLARWPCAGIEILAQCLRVFAVLPAQLCVRLLVRCVLVVRFSNPCILLEAVLIKLLPTMTAFVPLPPSALTVFLCAVRSSSYSAKSALKTGGEDKKAFSILL